MNAILAAGCAAPIGMGKYESAHLTVIQNKDMLAKLSAAAAGAMGRDGDVLYVAPTVVLISSADVGVPGIDYANAGCMPKTCSWPPRTGALAA